MLVTTLKMFYLLNREGGTQRGAQIARNFPILLTQEKLSYQLFYPSFVVCFSKRERKTHAIYALSYAANNL